MGIRKKRSFVFIVLVAVLLGLAFLHYRSVRLAIKSDAKVHTPDCSDGAPAHASIASSSDTILRKLSEYETVCHGSVVDTMMFFTAVPTTSDEADTLAQSTATRLKEFAKYKIKPLVSFEPNASIPTIINDLKAGTYDAILKTYFQNLKAAGISSQQLGTWILFPEANTPTWHNTDPAVFAANVTKLATIQRAIFPDCQLTILLNNTTYASNDIDWSHGTNKDLQSYVSPIPSETVNSFGYQGFPFIAPKDTPSQYGELDAKDFISISAVRGAANALHTKNIWINTGTFQYTHTDSPSEQVELSLSRRQQTLDSIVRQAGELQAQGLKISLNLFAKDKSNDPEHTDWSYWPPGKYSSSPNTQIFQTFVEQLRDRHIPLSLHDAL